MGLMKLKDKLEGQLGEIGISLRGVEEEMGKLKSKVEAANALLLMGLTTQAESDKTVLVISDEEKDYKICKPQGTFLWLDMSQAVAPNKEIVSIPTLPSASSSIYMVRLLAESLNTSVAATSHYANTSLINLNEVPRD
ncbi:hypothetical protein V6N13_010103 [Hibiscus sabdariffa]|uniref:Uncharacterized protein n=1 Tax=Hibiscus sabdariffa TaxID=183260 RepID=A0ABR2PQQ9_9ROSI